LAVRQRATRLAHPRPVWRGDNGCLAKEGARPPRLDGQIDPSFVITHEMELGEAPRGYDMFKNKQDECVKVVLKP
jgi:hypothetical protein